MEARSLLWVSSLSPYLLETMFLTDWLDGLASKLHRPLLSLSLQLRIESTHDTLAFYIDIGDPNTGPRVASPSLTEPSPQPYLINLRDLGSRVNVMFSKKTMKSIAGQACFLEKP